MTPILAKDALRRRENNLCSYHQERWLVKRGYKAGMSFEDACRILNAWKANGWKKPEGEI